MFSKFFELLTISILSILSNLLEKKAASLNSNKLLLIFLYKLIYFLIYCVKYVQNLLFHNRPYQYISSAQQNLS